MSAPRIIGLAGLARSGKDTVADYLCARHNFVRHSFAAPIRNFVADILGLGLGELERCKEQRIDWLPDRSPRYLMQTVGTEWGREMIHPELWVRSCAARIRRDTQAGRSVVLTDVRFDNEAEAVADMGGEVWHIERPRAGTSLWTHASEAGVFDELIDRRLMNDRDIPALHAAIESVLTGAPAAREGVSS